MAERQKPKVKADIKRNRIYITIPCNVSKKELEMVYTDVRFCVADLKPGFDVVTDLTGCSIGYLNGIPVLRKISDYLVTSEAAEVVRVVGKTSLIFKQLLRVASLFQGYKPFYVSTLAEAEEKLAGSIKRNGLRFRINSQHITYTINKEEGQGYLVDISTSGCKLRQPTIPLIADKEISINISFHQDQDTPTSFTISANVVRVQGDQVAVQFVDLDDDQKALLYQCVAFEARRELPLE
jgi:hypothetical protein